MTEPESSADAPSLPALAWGESVTWYCGRILVPLNRDSETVADLELDEAGARLLADMLADAAAPEPEPAPPAERTCAAGVWMDGHIAPDRAIERAREHYTACRDRDTECRVGDQAGLDELELPDARARVTYWRHGKQVTAEQCA